MPKALKIKEQKEKKRLVLFDAHAIIHRAYHALPDFASSKGEPTGALYGLSTMLIRIISDLKPDFLAACYDLPQPTYRHEAFDAYKAGRKKTDSELVSQLERSKEVFKAFGIPIYSHAGFEADDVLGTIVEKLKGDKETEIVIASGDMDTLQLVDNKKVQVFTLKKGINDTILYDEDAVLNRFGFGPELIPDYKGFRGDPSDNIPGIRGVGEKTATILIQNFGTVEAVYKTLKANPEKLEAAGITKRMLELLKAGEEEALFSKMLATIRRDAPFDFSLPEKSWRESFEIEVILELFKQLEFRTLGDRVRQLVGVEKTPLKEESEEVFDPKEFRELQVALWLLNSNITNPVREDILDFAKKETLKDAKDVLLQEIKKQNLTVVFEEIEKPLIPIISKMEEYGIKIDKKYLLKLGEEYHVELSKLEKAIWKEAGREFNINSPKQLGEILFDTLQLKVKNQKKTGGGARSTRESELEKIKDLHPIVQHILHHRELQKLLSTYIDSIPKLLDKNDRIHTHFSQTGSTTGRMSSNDPNIQNIPIKTDLGRAIRYAFVADKGFVLAAFDYSQIELRAAAILSNDPKLVEIFKGGGDVHTATASFVFGVPAPKVDAEMRRRAKVINFGIIYGMGVNALRANLGTTRDEAQKFMNDYFETFKGLATYLNTVKSEAGRKGYTETLFGRKRFFEGLKSSLPFIRAAAERMAINAPIQGTATADIIKLAMVKISEYIETKDLGNDVRLLLQVHDELIFEIKPDKVEKIVPEIKKLMEGILAPELSKGVPLVSTAKIGTSWGDMK